MLVGIYSRDKNFVEDTKTEISYVDSFGNRIYSTVGSRIKSNRVKSFYNNVTAKKMKKIRIFRIESSLKYTNTYKSDKLMIME